MQIFIKTWYVFKKSGYSGYTRRNPRKIKGLSVTTSKNEKWLQKGVVTLGLDLEKLNRDIETLRKNRENVPLDVLKTKYKVPFAKLKEEIRAQLQIYLKEISLIGILQIGSDLTEDNEKQMVDHIQKIIDEETKNGHLNEITDAVFEKFSLNKAEEITCRYYTSRIQYEVYAPYWLEHCYKDADGKFRNDMLPGMAWQEESGVWVTDDCQSFTIMMPPTKEAIEKMYQDERGDG